MMIRRLKKLKRFKSLKYSKDEFKALSGLWRVDRIILDTLNFKELTHEVVNTILTELDYLKLGYQIIVLTLVNKKKDIVERISISKTKSAATALRETPIPFKKIEIPLSANNNLLVRAVRSKKIYFTHDLSDVLYPQANREIWRQIQKACEIKTSMIYPIIAKGEALGAMIFSLSKGADEVGKYEKEILAGFTNAVGIAVENASLYQRLKKTNKRLKEVSAFKDELVSFTSHELRTPLTGISGSLSTILEGYAGKVSPKLKEFIEGSHNESMRLLRLVNNLLNISRIEAGRLKYELLDFDLNLTIEETIEGLKKQAEEKKLQVDYFASEKVMVKADQEKVREIIINLVGNAIKFTDNGGISLSVFNQGKAVVVAVEDTGRGVLPEDQPKLFKKFERGQGGKTSKKKGGTGLGLYICQNLLKGMGGDIWLRSEHGQGSTFYFVLPLGE
ncbi:hypothetical protein COT75_04055 [Candidatus Beckwithbacteria bacterium CG10_big_fil_rev_8_21_14_0_10_34_10]|uniref:histidine kinase n=1 Tax=Candidatus Beckwithbacteria bacterium CG10_big_fil_rev_8_21_14_0_10_34_10 TaxID=1974495 RepID=A0A2H0W8M3_9BACT|nr:MAG: hypothetical protein COT75_04055 [Candidatus Beckwithbacteria bacterium CG10_big_fil_rev_8_21_14_0_10_34_10]